MCKNEVINPLVEGHTKGKFVLGRIRGAAKLIFAHTSKDSTLRKWLVDDYGGSTINPSALHVNFKDFPQDFVLDVFKAFVEAQARGDGVTHDTVMDASKYYE